MKPSRLLATGKNERRYQRSDRFISTKGAKKWSEPTKGQRVNFVRGEGHSPRLVMKRTPQSLARNEGLTNVANLPNVNRESLVFLSTQKFLLLSLAVLLLVGVTAGLVRSNHQAVAHSYKISELTQMKLKLLETNRRLKTDLAKVSSLDELETRARVDLNLITPKQGQIVVLD